MEFGKAIAPDTFQIERTLKAPIARVWAYFTAAEKRSRWFNGGDDISATGQIVTMNFAHHRITDEKPPERWAEMECGEMNMKARVLAFEPPHLLAISWGDGDAHVSEVRFEFSAKGEETHLVLTHSHIDTTKNMRDFAGGWTAHLQTLADLIAGRPTNRFWAAVVEAHDVYERIIHERLSAHHARYARHQRAG